MINKKADKIINCIYSQKILVNDKRDTAGKD